MERLDKTMQFTCVPVNKKSNQQPKSKINK